MEIKPTIGRVVYYKTRGSADGFYPPKNFAAIITEVDEENETICLATFGKTGIRFEIDVKQGEEPGQWDWMSFQKD